MAGFVLDKNNRNFSDISCLLQRRERRRVRKRSVVLKQPPVREREQPGALKKDKLPAFDQMTIGIPGGCFFGLFLGICASASGRLVVHKKPDVKK